MKSSTVISVIVILLIAAGAWYYLSNTSMPINGAAATAGDTAQPGGPSGAAGINGSANQGNLGQPDSGVVQQPLADGAEGSIIGANLALGLDGAGAKTHLVGYTGMTVYTFDKDTTTASNCYGQCATNWPPYVVGPEDNLTQLKAGVTGKVDTIFRTDKSIQVTYNGHPLYFYAADKASSDTTGDGVGGVWHVVKP